MNESVKRVNLSKLLNKHKGVGCSVQNGLRLAEIRKSIGHKNNNMDQSGARTFRGGIMFHLRPIRAGTEQI